MDTCPSCGGRIGRDCFNPTECAAIALQMHEIIDCAECNAKDAELTTLRKQLDVATAEIGVWRKARDMGVIAGQDHPKLMHMNDVIALASRATDSDPALRAMVERGGA